MKKRGSKKVLPGSLVPPREVVARTSARFWKCALQVNPEGYSRTYRGKDHGLRGKAFLSALLKECQDQCIALVGLADHGSVADVDAIREYLSPHDIVVLPGFEICTTEKIHWVCLFHEKTPTEQLNRYLGALKLLDPHDGVRPSELGGAQLLVEVEKQGGFCYAAHVTGDKGLLKQRANHLWTDRRLRAAQIPGSLEALPYDCHAIVRNTDPAYGREHPIALINARDVAAPEDLRDPGASCFVKMTVPGFDAFCVAFKDPQSRIRLHHEIRESHCTRLERVRIDGGYLDGLEIELSPHLNTIIGGRGTGKSTLVECVRYALGLVAKGLEARKQGDAIVKENLGSGHGRVELTLVSETQRGKRFRIIRRYGEPIRVMDDNDKESSLTVLDLVPAIEIYGQNEIYEIARDKDALIGVLDRYLPNRNEHELTIGALQRKVKVNAEKLTTAWEQQEELQARLLKLPSLEEQLRQFDEIGLTKKLKQVPLLEKERLLPARISERMDGLEAGFAELRAALPDMSVLDDEILEGLPHADLLLQARAILDKVSASIAKRLSVSEKEFANARTEVTSLIVKLERARKASQDALQKGFAALPAIAGKSGAAVGRTYQALQQQIEAIRPDSARLEAAARGVKQLQESRRTMLGELSDMRSGRTVALQKEVRRLNKRLVGKLRLKVEPNANRKALKEFLARFPGIGEKSVEWVDEAGDLTVPGLVSACRQGASALLEKGWGVTSAKAEAIARIPRTELLTLEMMDLGDRVSLELNTSHEGEVYRELGRLSTGQQCTAILHLLLLDNPDPLIMDQPEDNLDNAFIADRIVQELRSAKTSRQFVFATHNANIPVFGDAEWIGVFSATDDHGAVPLENQGSIDSPRIRDEAARILDGGKEAFLQRQLKYGY